MRSTFLFALFLVPLLAWGESITGVVVGVHDGDTITLLTAAKTQVKIRLYGIDAPELNQPFGKASKQALSAIVFQHEVRVEVINSDRYGRTVGRVFVGDTDVNTSQVRAGWAWWYRQYAPRDEILETAEAEARAARRGLWQDRAPVPPWTYRQEHRPHPMN